MWQHVSDVTSVCESQREREGERDGVVRGRGVFDNCFARGEGRKGMCVCCGSSTLMGLDSMGGYSTLLYSILLYAVSYYYSCFMVEVP